MGKDIWKSGRVTLHSSLPAPWTDLAEDDLELDLERLAYVFEDYSAEKTAISSDGDSSVKHFA